MGTPHRIPNRFSTGKGTEADPKGQIFGHSGVDHTEVVTIEYYDRHLCYFCEFPLLVLSIRYINRSATDVIDEEGPNWFVSHTFVRLTD